MLYFNLLFSLFLIVFSGSTLGLTKYGDGGQEANCRYHKGQLKHKLDNLKAMRNLQSDVGTIARLNQHLSEIQGAYRQHRCSLETVSGCTTLSDGTRYCVKHKGFAKTLKSNHQYLKFLDRLNYENRNTLANNSLEVIGFYESKYRNICNRYGYCGPFQVGRSAWRDFRPKNRSASRKNRYDNARVIPELVKGYRKITQFNERSIYSDFIHTNLGPGNVLTKIKIDRGQTIYGKESRRFVNAVCNNLPTDVRNRHCRGKRHFSLKRTSTIKQLSAVYEDVWRFNLSLISRDFK